MNFPSEFCQRLKPLLGDQWDDFVAAYDQPIRRGLRVNTVKMPTERLINVFSLPLTPSPFAANSFYLDAEHKAGSDPLHHGGAYYMQEPSATSAVTVLAPKAGEKILDLCAAPGGKSTQIAAALGDSGLLWCNEYVSSRARILDQNIERCGVRRVVISNNNTNLLCRKLEGFFDAALVDAPCSGEGMFRKEPQALKEWSVDNVRACANRQAEILHNASLAVRAGGRLVYSTCTFAPEENEAVIAAFLAEHPNFSLEPIEVPWGSSAFSFDEIRPFTDLSDCAHNLTRCRRIFPQHGGEGHFVAKLRNNDNVTYVPPTTYAPPSRDEYRQSAKELYADCFVTPPVGEFVTFGGYVHLLPPDLPDLSELNILRGGIVVAQVCKNRLEPCHTAFMASSLTNCKRKLDLSLHDPRTVAYLHGEEIVCNGENGWTAVGIEGVTVGFGKCVGGRLKNRYPKGLRLL